MDEPLDDEELLDEEELLEDGELLDDEELLEDGELLDDGLLDDELLDDELLEDELLEDELLDGELLDDEELLDKDEPADELDEDPVLGPLDELDDEPAVDELLTLELGLLEAPPVVELELAVGATGLGPHPARPAASVAAGTPVSRRRNSRRSVLACSSALASVFCLR